MIVVFQYRVNDVGGVGNGTGYAECSEDLLHAVGWDFDTDNSLVVFSDEENYFELSILGGFQSLP